MDVVRMQCSREEGGFVLLLVKSGQAQLTMVLPSMAHRWYALGSEIQLCLDDSLRGAWPFTTTKPWRQDSAPAGR